jgi:hypothetical protein
MAIAFEAARAIIEKRFFDTYVKGSAPGNFDIFLEGRQFTQPVGTPWAVLFIDDSANAVKGFNDDREAMGVVRFKLYSPHGSGTKQVREIADYIDNIMSRTAGTSGTSNTGTLYIRSGSIKKLSDNDNGYLSYNLDFLYDYYY